jgi:hypothetical protein
MYLRYSKIIYEFICLFKFFIFKYAKSQVFNCIFSSKLPLASIDLIFRFSCQPVPNVRQRWASKCILSAPHFLPIYAHFMYTLPHIFLKTHFIHIFAICLAHFSSPVAQEPLPRWCAVLPQGFHGKMRWNGGRSS